METKQINGKENRATESKIEQRTVNRATYSKIEQH
jgi:hypothetical protein